MPKKIILDASLCDRIDRQQLMLSQQLINVEKRDVLCPYCRHKLQSIYKGYHAGFATKCPKCKKEVKVGPLSFRIKKII